MFRFVSESRVLLSLFLTSLSVVLFAFSLWFVDFFSHSFSSVSPGDVFYVARFLDDWTIVFFVVAIVAVVPVCVTLGYVSSRDYRPRKSGLEMVVPVSGIVISVVCAVGIAVYPIHRTGVYDSQVRSDFVEWSQGRYGIDLSGLNDDELDKLLKNVPDRNRLSSGDYAPPEGSGFSMYVNTVNDLSHGLTVTALRQNDRVVLVDKFDSSTLKYEEKPVVFNSGK